MSGLNWSYLSCNSEGSEHELINVFFIGFCFLWMKDSDMRKCFVDVHQGLSNKNNWLGKGSQP